MHPFRFHFISLFLIALLWRPPAAVAAEDVGPVRSDHVSADLVGTETAIQPGKHRDLILRLVMDPGWHTYWKNPGDSGEPVRIEWELPAGLKAAGIRWPTPIRISSPPLMTYGYEGRVLFLTGLSADEGLAPGRYPVVARARWLECADICLPGKAEFSFQIEVAASETSDVAGGATGPHAELFAEAFAALPAASGSDAQAQESPRARRTAAGLELPVRAPGVFASLYFFEESGHLLEHAAPQQLTGTGDGTRLQVKLDPNASLPDSAKVGGVLVSEDWLGRREARRVEWKLAGEASVEAPAAGPATEVVSAAPERPSPASVLPGSPGELNFLWALLFSFLGGMILNLMPCVFPVLSLKVFSFIKHAGADGRVRWISSAAYTGGILVSFWALALSLIVLRGTGQALGWGFQLQSPLFVFLLCIALFLFALNLLGVFEISISLTGLGGEERAGWSGAFFSGVLAVVVATPCTAPFMGAALGYALTQSTAVALGVFSALGLGLAAPFLLLATFPAVARVLPRPGDWMVTLKQVMGFLMLATVLWLVWVYGRLTDTDGVALLLGAFLLAGVGAWVWGRWNLPSRSGSLRWSARAIAFALVLAAGLSGTLYESIQAVSRTGIKISEPEGLISRAGQTGPASGAFAKTLADFREARSVSPGKPLWIDYSPELVADLQGRGVPMLIDFTADWCLSCKVNERVALSSERVWKSFADAELVTIKADWTNEDERITRALAGYGRSGIPLYVFYDKSGDYIFWPEVLTEGLVLDYIRDRLKSEQS